MAFLKILFVCTLMFGLSNCRKKAEAVGKEVREAGYAMTAEGWFGAVKSNDASVMRKMMEGGFDAKIPDADGNVAMHVAAAAGSKEAGEFLLTKGFSINAKGAKGHTPLMAAVLANRPEMVKWLLKQGADPKLKDNDDFMALMLAVTNGSKGCIEELAPYHREDLDSALLLASLVGNAEVIDTLTNYGASVYARMEDGRTPLMLAAQNGHKEATAMLIDIGASRFATLESGDTAQSLAVAAGHSELAGLIEKGFSGDVLALETDAEVAKKMGDHLDKNQAPSKESSSGGAFAAKDPEKTASATRNVPLPGQYHRGFGQLPVEAGDAAVAVIGRKEPVRSLEGATVSGTGKPVKVKLPEGVTISGMTGAAQKSERPVDVPVERLPLVMRDFRQRELSVEVKKVSGGVASLHLAGAKPKEVQVRQGDKISGSNLVVLRIFSRTEHGKLNNGEPIEVGVVEVEDKDSGQKREWLEGRPATGHDPVALVEDAATGSRYVAKPGQRFHSEDGHEFIVNDVRPAQLVLEDVASGEVRTLRLRGPRG